MVVHSVRYSRIRCVLTGKRLALVHFQCLALQEPDRDVGAAALSEAFKSSRSRQVAPGSAASAPCPGSAGCHNRRTLVPPDGTTANGDGAHTHRGCAEGGGRARSQAAREQHALLARPCPLRRARGNARVRSRDTAFRVFRAGELGAARRLPARRRAAEQHVLPPRAAPQPARPSPRRSRPRQNLNAERGLHSTSVSYVNT